MFFPIGTLLRFGQSGMAFNPYSEWLGIPSHEQPPNYYRLLGLPDFENDSHAVKQSFYSLSQNLSELVDGPRGSDARRLISELKHARETLLDRAKKSNYDQLLRGKPSIPTPIDVEEIEELDQIAAGPQLSRKPSGHPLAMIGMIVAILLGPISAAGLFYLVTGNHVSDLVPADDSDDEVLDVGRATTSDDELPRGAHSGIDAPEPFVPNELDRLRNLRTRHSAMDTNEPVADNSAPTTHPSRNITQRNPAKNAAATTNDTTRSPVQSTNASPAGTPSNSSSGRKIGGAFKSNISPPARVRKPCPDEQNLLMARKAVAERFQDRIAAATSAGAKIQLSRELVRLSDEGELPDSEQFALLELAVEQGIATGYLKQTNELIRELTGRYRVSDFAYRAQAFDTWGKLVTEQYQGDDRKIRNFSLGMMAVELAEDAAQAKEYSIAGEMYRFASRQLRLGGEVERSRETAQLARGFDQLQKKRDAVTELVTQHTDEADNAELNQRIARILCFEIEDWSTGVAYLAKGTDRAMKPIARNELQLDSDAVRIAEVADQWWTLADSQKLTEKKLLRRHAVELYERVVAQLNGLPRQLAQNRMKEVGPVTALIPKPLLHYNFERRSLKQDGRIIVVQNAAGDFAHGRTQHVRFDEGGLDEYAAIFRGTQWIDFPNTAAVIRENQGLTLSGWIKTERHRYQIIAGKFTRGLGSSDADFGLHITTSGTLQGSARFDTMFLTAFSNDRVPLDVWCHVALVWNREELKLFLNGEPAGSAGYSSDDELELQTEHSFRIGGGASGIPFDGAMDEIKLFSRGLSDLAVLHLYLMNAP